MRFSGGRNGFFWAEWQDPSTFLRDLIEECPGLVIGKYLVNTSFDSGSLKLADEEISEGWYKKDKLTFSPAIRDVEMVPFDQYDEWYVFAHPSSPQVSEVFINYGGFSVHESDYADAAERFWGQLSIVRPETYLAEGDHLICVTSNQALFEKILAWRN